MKQHSNTPAYKPSATESLDKTQEALQKQKSGNNGMKGAEGDNHEAVNEKDIDLNKQNPHDDSVNQKTTGIPKMNAPLDEEDISVSEDADEQSFDDTDTEDGEEEFKNAVKQNKSK